MNLQAMSVDELKVISINVKGALVSFKAAEKAAKIIKLEQKLLALKKAREPVSVKTLRKMGAAA